MEMIAKILKKEIQKNADKQMMVLCIGTEKVIGDSLGPMTGEKLSQMNLPRPILVKGSLKHPIHYLNFQDEWEKINRKYAPLFTLVVDSSLYREPYIGKTILTKGKTTLGDTIHKKKYCVGNCTLKGVVGQDFKNPIQNMQVLEHVSQQLIQEMSNQIVQMIVKGIS